MSKVPHWIMQPGGQQDLDLRMEQLGQFLVSLFVGQPSCWLALVQGWGGNAWGLLFAGAAFTGGNEPHSLSSPWASLKLTLG